MTLARRVPPSKSLHVSRELLSKASPSVYHTRSLACVKCAQEDELDVHDEGLLVSVREIDADLFVASCVSRTLTLQYIMHVVLLRSCRRRSLTLASMSCSTVLARWRRSSPPIVCLYKALVAVSFACRRSLTLAVMNFSGVFVRLVSTSLSLHVFENSHFSEYHARSFAPFW